MSCGCLGVLYKPRYKRQVDEIYPRDPLDEKIIATEMDKLRVRKIYSFYSYFFLENSKNFVIFFQKKQQ